MIHLSAETWNRYYPVGTRVLYEPVRDRGEYEERVTRSAAYETQNGPMVQLVGRPGGFLLRHLAPIEIPHVEKMARTCAKHADCDAADTMTFRELGCAADHLGVQRDKDLER